MHQITSHIHASLNNTVYPTVNDFRMSFFSYFFSHFHVATIKVYDSHTATSAAKQLSARIFDIFYSLAMSVCGYCFVGAAATLLNICRFTVINHS